MGVIYKLKPEVIEFIKEQKKANPSLSCRGLVALVEQKFKAKVSKSSINAVIKESGLSSPVGRTKKKPRIQMPPLPMLAARAEAPALEAKAAEEAQRKAAEEAARKAKEEEEAKRKAEVEAKVKAEEEAKAKAEAERKAKEEAEKKAEEARRKEEEEKKAQEAALQAEQEKWRIKAEEEKKAREAAEKAKAEEEKVKVAIPSGKETTGAILLKAMDYLFGGSASFAETIQKKLAKPDAETLAKTESLIYAQLFKLDYGPTEADLSRLWSLIDRKISLEEVKSFLAVLEQDAAIAHDLQDITPSILQEARFIKVNFPVGNSIYLDGQMRSVWSTPHIPYDFSSTFRSIKSYINRYFAKEEPFALFMAPGYETPSKEFFRFLLSLNSQEQGITALSLCGNRFEELETLPLGTPKKRPFVFGLWPWQFTGYRQVEKINEFKPFNFEGIKKELYLAEIEINLLEPASRQPVSLRGCALKTSLTEKTRLVILSNMSAEKIMPEDLARFYLNHWPNLDEGFQDYSRKIELFTYTGGTQLTLPTTSSLDIKSILNNYLQALDLYFKRLFLPQGSENKDFLTLKADFYDLKTTLTPQKECTAVIFQPPQGYQFSRDLEYACRRLNEREILFSDGKRLWFSV